MATELLTADWAPENFFTAYLSTDITDSATDIFLDVVPTQSEGTLVIDPESDTNREIIYYSSKTGTKVVCPGNGRGYDNTTAISHLTGTKVIMAPVADWFNSLKTLFTTTPQGWSDLGDVPDTVTYNGNRSYDLVFNSNDLTDTVSNGMRLKLTRTVTAPTQCTDLESGSSQYYSRASAGLTGITFTDDFVVSAWVKLEAYADMSVIGRYNGTSGWSLDILADGTVRLRGRNASASNHSSVNSYQSLPLGKWVHIAAQLDMSSYTATTTTSYVMIDGVDVPAFVSRGGTNPTALVQAGDLQIGASNSTLFFDGKLAQVALYSAKVTQATIKASIPQTLSGSETSAAAVYSFNNTIEDLTANNNDLTAQASAVATNVDSPFAGADFTGYTAGTTEMAVVTKTAFSTNTTLTVQVPEGYAIPTSGGVSAVAYSTQDVPYGFPGDRARWQLQMLSADSSSTITSGSFNNVGNIRLSVPVGAWKLRASVYADCTRNASTAIAVGGAISESTSAVTAGYEDATDVMTTGGASGTQRLGFNIKPQISKSFTAQTTVYHIIYATITAGGLSSAAATSASNQHSLTAEFAYV